MESKYIPSELLIQTYIPQYQGLKWPLKSNGSHGSDSLLPRYEQGKYVHTQIQASFPDG